jgi:ankyrin repeat protein
MRKRPAPPPQPGLDRDGRSALHYAASEDNPEAVARLLRDGADTNLQDHRGWTPLHFAAQANSARCVEMLLRGGANPTLSDSDGNTALFRAVFASRGSGEVIRLLRSAGADPNALNFHGVSPLTLARTIGNYNVAQFFADLP